MHQKRIYKTPNPAPQRTATGVVADAEHYEARRLKSVQLFFDEGTRRWMVVIGSGRPMPATDVEVTLWLRLQEAQGQSTTETQRH